ncbi:hypothetical protein COV12_02960 [Candidatus Woesearchaeota archaeon CG10_big_fil_rev_8_21_14_0_10_32_24]|nr:MAG: hypothetical protein COV12_02960 [Candidatus Woesearchaeota archaeon CG10_big_fil_rev_8_21_14_0_10_32_24]
MANKKRGSKKIKELKHNARRHSIKEGLFTSAREAFGDYYVSPFAIAINASNTIIALLTSVSGLLGPASQTFSSKLIGKFSRKRIVLKSFFFESLSWLLLVAIAILFYKNIITSTLPLLLLISFALYSILANIGHPAWFSWIGDIVDEKYRARWFSKRDLLLGVTSIVLAILASVFLDYFKKRNWMLFGFMILFFLAFLMRFFSWRILKKQYEPKIKLKKTPHFSFKEFIVNAPKNNFGRFVIFRSVFAFATAICSPFFAVYLLKNINFSYTEYMVVTLGGTFISLFALELWGKFADRYGNYRTIVIASIFISIAPVLWVLSQSMIYLLLVPSIIGGVAWTGFYLTARDFIYDNVSPQKRSQSVSYYNMMSGFGIFFGALLGAFLIKTINTEFVSSIIAVFIISSIARFLAVLIFIPRIKEIKKIEKFNSKSFENLLLKETKPTLIEETRQLMSIKKYLEEK